MKMNKENEISNIKPEIISSFKKKEEEHSSIDENYELSIFEKEYTKARHSFEEGEYSKCAEKCENLLKNLLINIIDKNHRKLDLYNNTYSKKLKEISLSRKEKEKVTSLEQLELKRISELFDDIDVNYFVIAGDNYKKYSPLLNSFNYGHISDLIDYCKTEGLSSPGVKLGSQQILNSITALLLARRKDMKIEQYHLLVNYQHLREEIKQIQDSHNKLSTVKSELFYIYEGDEKERVREVDKREFEWIRYRGMLINKHDESRNIAFKVETFDHILSTIYEGITRELNNLLETVNNNESKPIKDRIYNNEELRKTPKTIILDAGYLSGLNFGWTMHEIIQRQNERLSLAEKIEKWCAFDSDVGFGKLELIKDEDTKLDRLDNINFKIELSDNFIVYKRDSHDINLCSFIAGYIQGVLEKVTQQSLKVVHKPIDCEQFEAGRNSCVFTLMTNTKEMEKIGAKVNKLYHDDLTPSVNKNLKLDGA